MRRKKLSDKELLFCAYYTANRDARAAAAKAGYVRSPEKTAMKLLNRSEVQAEIEKQGKRRKPTQQELCEGYRRLAFGSVTDAFKLLQAQTPPAQGELEQMDLFNISDLKFPKNGGFEIKFFDRIKALDALAQLKDSEQGGGMQHFLRVIDNSAQSLAKRADDQEA